jgi:hypothetical protein
MQPSHLPPNLPNPRLTTGDVETDDDAEAPNVLPIPIPPIEKPPTPTLPLLEYLVSLPTLAGGMPHS